MTTGICFSCVRGSERPLKPKAIEIRQCAPGERTNFFLPLYEDATGSPLQVPFIVARGKKKGPTVGITAAVHGNELNGIKIIQNVLEDLNLEELRGSVLCAPVVNVPGYNLGRRYFSDGVDLNNKFPGKPDGVPAEQYARAFTLTFLPACDYLIDIHTASEGRTNTLYVRADFESPLVRELALMVNPEIILHVRGGDGTLRSAARRRGIPAITLEAGNPSVLQGKMVFEGERGVKNILMHLGMMNGKVELRRTPVICQSSKWIRTTGGGILETKFRLLDRIEKKQLLAQTQDPFGNILQRYYAPSDGIVIGMAANPAAFPGTRFCHLGLVGEPSDELSAEPAVSTAKQPAPKRGRKR
ncbi:MAG: succinylglutamate desuccinylase/aspartoacylase family protein [Bdellovibrionales bacterium]|nr:succinylglutamate desuccinylase/aspartoacylase family protein [Bdellovibrionales bacterium]